MHWLTHAGQPSVAFPSLALPSESLTLRNYKGSQHPLGSGQLTLSVPLQNGLRFFPDELPDVPSVRLAVTLSLPATPGQETAGLPRFVCATHGPVRSPPSTGGIFIRDWSALSPSAWPLTCWFQPIPTFGLSISFGWLAANDGARVQLRLTMRPES